MRGTLTAAWTAACSRCLEPVAGEISVHVDELFETLPLEGETYQLDEDVIDLEPMVRDALLLELPLAPLCSADCAGLCADLRREPQPDALRVRHRRARPPLGGARSLEL